MRSVSYQITSSPTARPPSTRFKTAMMLFAEFLLPRLLESGFEVVGAVADGNALCMPSGNCIRMCDLLIFRPYLSGNH